jgi:inosine-uridine nucleoside N-ribohydrolase
MTRTHTLATLLVFSLVSATTSLFSQLQEPSPPVNVIIDSDASIDADDMGDHAIMWGLANRGEVNVLAIIVSSANDYSAPALQAVANYYGHPNVPIGANKGSTPNINSSATSAYTRQIATQFGTPGETRASYPDAVTVYRQALANASDNSVYIVANGYYEPLQQLLQSQADAISPLTGMQLVTQKVRRLVSSAGWFPSGSESNFMTDTDAASYVFANWPGEIVSIGADTCFDVVTGPSSTSDPAQDPVKAAYNLYATAQGLSSATTPAWGQLGLLYAVRGGVGTNFTIGGFNGTTTIDATNDQFRGQNFWSPTPQAGRSYLKKQIAASDMAAIINPLLQSSSNMPILRSISPTSVFVGSPGQTVTINGTNFFQDSQVMVNGSSRTTTFVNGTQLTVQLNAGDLSQVGNQALNVANSSEGNWTSNTINLTVAAATPTISSISPSSSTAGSGPITLTVTGSSFMSNSVIQVNGAAHATTFISGSQLATTLTTADLATAGTLSITVTTPGGGTSSSVAFTVNNPVPGLSTLSPASVVAGGSGFTLTVSGSNFVRGSVVQVNGANRSTAFVSASQLTATIPASDIAVGGFVSITVFNAAPGGGTSPALTLNVNNPVPSISSISPNPALAVASGFTLTVSGTGFVRGSIIQVDGASQTTTFVSSTQVQAKMSGGILALGIHTVTVFNPTPGGGTSNSVNLTVISILGELMPASPQSSLAVLTAKAESFFVLAG